MTSLVGKLKNTYEKNLKFFQKKVPILYEMANLRGKRNVELLIQNNKLNLKVDGQLFYPNNYYPEEMGKIQAENFLNKPSRLLFPPQSLLGRVERETLTHKALNELQEKLVPYCAKNFEHDPKFIPFLITFGLGLGYHLQHLLKLTEVKYLVVLEEDIELLKATFYTLDWKKIIEYFSRPGRDIFISVNDSPQALYQDLFNAYQKTHPMFGVLSYAWSVTNSSLFFQVLDLIKEKLFLVLRGWGFYDDEFCSLVQTTVNVLKKVPIFIPKRSISSKTLAIIVGAGPSLDERINFLKKEASRSVIISCGTALRTLESEGIVPDFHVEIERTKRTYDIISSTINPEFLSHLNMIAGNPLWHEYFDLGRASFMFLKANDAGAAIFPKEIPWLYCCNPTVTNAGLSFAVYAGFKHIALVGVDLGAPDPSLHHSRKTAYYDSQGPLANFKGDFDRVVTLPDGRKVFTNSLFFWSKAAIEDLIKSHPDIRVYNLSQGLHFEGTIKIEPDALNFVSEDKQESIYSVFYQIKKDHLDRETLVKRLKNLCQANKYFLRHTERILKNSNITKSRRLLVETLCNLYHFTFSEIAKKDLALFILYKGSVMHFSNRLFFSSYLIHDPKNREIFLEEGKEIFLGFLRRAYENLKVLTRMVEQTPEEILRLTPRNMFYILV